MKNGYSTTIKTQMPMKGKDGVAHSRHSELQVPANTFVAFEIGSPQSANDWLDGGLLPARVLRHRTVWPERLLGPVSESGVGAIPELVVFELRQILRLG
jgi:hypothetical protein